MGEKSNINTPYDDVFHTLAERSPHLMIPLVNERFHTSYTMDMPAEPLANEHFYTDAEMKQVKRVTDSCIKIMNHLYHIECQTWPDGSIAIRMVEYDFHIALTNVHMNHERQEISFPQLAILYLRSNGNTPDEEKIDIVYADGTRYTYKVPIIKIKDYTKEELFEKQLYVLIPFYIFKYEKELQEINSDESRLKRLQEEFIDIKNRLEELKRQNIISAKDIRNVCVLSNKVIDNIANKYKKVREGVEVIMGGHLIDTDAYLIELRGIKLGKEQGKLQGINALIADNLEDGRDRDIIIAKLQKRFGLNEEDAVSYMEKFENNESEK